MLTESEVLQQRSTTFTPPDKYSINKEYAVRWWLKQPRWHGEISGAIHSDLPIIDINGKNTAFFVPILLHELTHLARHKQGILLGSRKYKDQRLLEEAIASEVPTIILNNSSYSVTSQAITVHSYNISSSELTKAHPHALETIPEVKRLYSLLKWSW